MRALAVDHPRRMMQFVPPHTTAVVAPTTEMMNCSHSRVLFRRRRCINALLDEWRQDASVRAASARRAIDNVHARACLQNNSHSQYQEDLLLVPLLHRMGARRAGVFVELGALDGIKYSNTWLLEKCFGWTGLLIEGNPSNAQALQRSGRRALMRHSAVCRRAGTVRMTVAGAEVSGQIDAMADKFVRNWHHRNLPSATVAVPCAPLSSLMDDADLPTADLLSLDVEGAEAIVLRTVDPARFWVVLVEMDGLSASKDEEVHQLLTASGLVHLARLRIPNSRVYARHDARKPFALSRRRETGTSRGPGSVPVGS